MPVGIDYVLMEDFPIQFCCINFIIARRFKTWRLISLWTMFDIASQKYVAYVLTWIFLAYRQAMQFYLIAYLLATFKGRNAFILVDAIPNRKRWMITQCFSHEGRAKRKCAKKKNPENRDENYSTGHRRALISHNYSSTRSILFWGSWYLNFISRK